MVELCAKKILKDCSSWLDSGYFKVVEERRLDRVLRRSNGI